MVTDLDAELTRIRDHRTRVYFSEALKCFRAGALRSAVAATWVTVAYDIIAKYRELSGLGDAEAERYIRVWDQAIAGNQTARLLELERNLLGHAHETTVAPLLAYLRELQRRHAIAVVVVHHAKKGAGHVRAGQALRGSSEFHAWGDSNLYLRRNRDPRENGDITLTVEHRAAPAMPSVTLELAQRANALALEVIEPRTPQTPTPSSVDERITAALTDVDRPVAFSELRARCRVRTATLYERLAALIAAGRLGRSEEGYRLAGH